jgi:hypothetical protein
VSNALQAENQRNTRTKKTSVLEFDISGTCYIITISLFINKYRPDTCEFSQTCHLSIKRRFPKLIYKSNAIQYKDSRLSAVVICIIGKRQDKFELYADNPNKSYFGLNIMI